MHVNKRIFVTKWKLYKAVLRKTYRGNASVVSEHESADAVWGLDVG